MEARVMSGVERIASVFRRTRSLDRAALMPYFTLGYPDEKVSIEIIQAIANTGADLIELGVPFSDPLADGPTIQHSAQVALERGMNVSRCLELTAELRQRGVGQPLMLMGYINPILAYGIERFAQDASICGVDGLIVPDLPPEEADEVERACTKAGLANIFLLSPTSTEERIRLVVARSRGFVYLVSVSGVTGVRTYLAGGLTQFVQRVRRFTDTPLAIGFGISTPEQARQVGHLVDGVIIGSALINAVTMGNDPVQSAVEFIAGIQSGMNDKS